MQLIFETRDPQAARWREMAERRLRFVIRRLQWLVPQARIRLSDLNGPRGGVDIGVRRHGVRCALHAVVRPRAERQ